MAPSSSRRVVYAAAGGAVLVLLVAAVLLANRGGGDASPQATTPAPTASAPARTTAPPSTGPGRSESTRFGAAPEGARNNYPAASANADQTLGQLGVVRVYYPGAPDPWPGKAPGRSVVVSFKLPPQEVIAGTHDDQMRAWFADAPRDLDINWVYHHEPEPDISKTQEFTAEQFRTAFAHLAALAKEVDNPRLKATLVLQSYTLKPQSGRNWRDYYPGDDAVEVFAWDVYNRPTSAEPYSTPEELMDGPRQVSESVGKPFAVAELGSILAPGDDGAQRAAWLRAVGAYVKAHRTDFVAYFDLNFTGGINGQDDYRLRDPDSLQAWHDIAAA